MNFYSAHPLSQKLSTAKGLINRVVRLTNNSEFNKIGNIKEILRTNNFPSYIINRLIQQYISNSNSYITDTSGSTNTAARNSELPIYRSLTFIPKLSEPIAKMVRAKMPNLKLAFRNHSTASIFFTQLKDKREKEVQTCVIYSIPCSTWDSSYIGMTTQLLRSRISQHRTTDNNYVKHKHSLCLDENDLVAQENLTRLACKTALIKHTINFDHRFDFSNTKILGQERDANKLAILEMLHISKNKCVNSRTDIDGLSRAYAGFLNKLS